MSDNFQQVIQLAFEVLGADDAQRVADTLQGVGTAGDKANSQLGPLISSFEDLANKAQLVQTAIDLQAKIDTNAEAFARAKQGLADLNTEFDKTDKSSVDVSAAFSQAQKAVTSLANEQVKLQTAFAANQSQLKAAGVDTTNLGAAQADLSAKTQAAAAQLTSAAADAKNLANAHKDVAESATSAGTAFQFFKDHLVEIASAAALAGAAFKAIEFGKEFGAEALQAVENVQQSLARVQASAQGTKEQFEAMDEVVNKAAQDVNVSSEVAAQGLAALASQGLTAKQAMDALVPTLELSRIANVDVGQAAKDVASILKGFNLPASDAASIVDKLTLASHGAAGGLSAMADAAVQLAPDAKALGLSFDQALSALGLVESKGIDAGNAVRGLRTVFQDLANPTSALRVQLLGLGDGTNDFSKAIATLNGPSRQAQQALNTLSGGARTVIELLGQAGPDALAKFQIALAQSNGSAKSFIETLDNTTGGALTRFKNAFGDIGEALAKPVLKPLQDELNFLSLSIRQFVETDDFKQLEGQIGSFATGAFKALNGFLSGIDWKKFADDAVANVQRISDNLGTVAKAAGILATVVNKSADGLGAGFHQAAAAVDAFKAEAEGLGSVTAKSIGNGLFILSTSFGTFTQSAVVAKSNLIALGDALQTAAIKNAAAAAVNFKATVDSVKDLAGAAKDSATAVQQATDAHAQFASTLLKQGEDAAKDVVELLGLPPALVDIAEKTGKVAASALDAAPKYKTFSDALNASADSAKSFQERFQAAQTALALAGSSAEKSAAQFQVLQTSFEGLKVKSQEDLKAAADAAETFFNNVNKLSANNAAGLADRQTAFLKYADAALAASANLDDGTKESIRIQLEQEGATLHVSDALTQLEGKYKGVGDQVVITTNRIADNGAEMEIAAQKAQKYADAMAVLRDTSASLGDKMKAAAEAITNAGDSTEKQAAVAESARASIEAEAGAASSLAQVLANVQAQFNAVSQAAGSNFSDAMSRALQNIGLTKEAVSDLSDSFGKLNAASSDTSGFVAYFNALTSAAAETQRQIDAQKASVAQQTAAFNNFATSSSASLDQLVSKLGVTQASLAAMDEQLKAGTYNAGLLGQQDLAGLQQAVDATIAKVQALKDATKAASDQFVSLAQSVHDELLQQLGDQAALENERDANTLAQLLALKQAGQVSDDQYAKALADEKQLHALKMADIAAQAAAQKSSSTSGGSGASDSGSGTDSGAGASGGGGLNPRGQLPASPSASSTPPGNTVVYNVAFNPTIYGANDAQMMDLARALKKNLDIIAARSR